MKPFREGNQNFVNSIEFWSSFEYRKFIRSIFLPKFLEILLTCQLNEILPFFSFSCDKVAWIDERNFWTFEGVLLVVGALSTGVTILRKRSLDRIVMLKVQRQLEQSV